MKNELVDIFNKLSYTNSIKEKEKILLEHKDNEQFVELLFRNLNPNQLFQFSELPEDAKPGKGSKKSFDSFIELVDKLYVRQVTGHAARDEVIKTFGLFTQEEFDLYSKILLKGPIGVTGSTANKVIPNLVPDFRLMLAPNKQADITKLKYPYMVQPKLDGYRAVFKEGIFISRTGKPFGNARIPRFFEQLKSVKDYVLDGEVYAHGMTFNKLQTCLNTHTAPLPYSLKYIVYDCVPLKDWEKQSCNIPYEERLKKARELLNTYVASYKKIIDIPNDLVYSSKEVVDLYKKYLADGYEGAMLKDPIGKYQWKRVTVRNGAMLKLKPFKSIDLKITGFYDGEGKNEGKAGGFTVDYNGTSVRVGTGLTDDLRSSVAAEPSKYMGKTIEVKYLEETEDKSLRHPVFIRFREEKD